MARPGNGGTFMSGCTGCGGCASGCGGCQSHVLILTEAEIRLLRRFALQVKRLISCDFALPLQGFDYAGYEDYPVRGSMALTAAGQEALDSLNIQGCGE